MNKKWLKLMAVIGAFLLFSVLLVLVQKLIVLRKKLQTEEQEVKQLCVRTAA